MKILNGDLDRNVSIKQKKMTINNEAHATTSDSTSQSKTRFCKSRKKIAENHGYGTGKRKCAVARVWVKAGSGKILVNNKELDLFCLREYYKKQIIKPFVVTNSLGQYDVTCTVRGGGLTGQAEAISHGIGRALDAIREDLHPLLRSNGILTRDARVVERKKYGKRKARKSTQFSKR